MKHDKTTNELVRSIRSYRTGIDASSLSRHLKKKSIFEVLLLSAAMKLPGVSQEKKAKFAKSAFLGLVWLSRRRSKKLEKILSSGSGTATHVASAPAHHSVSASAERLNLFDGGSHKMHSETAQVPVVLALEACGRIDIGAGEEDPIKLRLAALPSDYDAAEDRIGWLQDNAPRVSTQYIDACAGKKCLSLDIFDTFLLRNGDAEADRYFQLSEFILKQLAQNGLGDLVESISPEGLTLLRKSAMQTTYRCRPRRNGAGEGTIEDVAAVVAGALGGDSTVAAQLIEYEIAYESTVLRPNPLLRPVMAAAVDAGMSIIGLSDMYLPAAVINDICTRVDPEGFLKINKVFSSADTIVSKRSGLIFAEIEAEMGLRPEDFLHIGDSFVSDVRNPREAGWAVGHLPVSQNLVRSREKSLQRSIERSRNAGVDIRSWAKV
ncbi:hypothetical protein [Tropicimonas sp. IMCC34043]|uniref:hypothetical protein n=1 Tax=Tropicimonas sp. IMCC34043 TaxID=2248760 RepID=UPI000E233785|nr:hypothetical protein [Tropicimonas sp. IMCC34043]